MEAHSNSKNIVCGSYVNRVCSGWSVRLFEREDPDDERRKKKRMCPVDDESREPIPVVLCGWLLLVHWLRIYSHEPRCAFNDSPLRLVVLPP